MTHSRTKAKEVVRLHVPESASELHRLALYQLSIALSELEVLESRLGRDVDDPLFNKPHIEKLLRTPPVRVLLGHMQNLIWTVRRLVVPPDHSQEEAKSPLPYRPLLEATDFDQTILRQRPRFLLDVTKTHRETGHRGGIPRVCRELAREGVATGLALPVFISEGRLFPHYAHAAWDGPISLSSNDHYVIIDEFWEPAQDYTNVLRTVRQAGATASILVHDVFPIQYPAVVGQLYARDFRDRLRDISGLSDFFISVSRTSLNHLEAHLSRLPPERFGWFHLGADGLGPTGDCRQAVKNLFERSPVFLSVGTVEPRKGYPFALDAFERLWADGVDAHFVIMGKRGWAANRFEDRLATHPEAGKRLHRIADATDDEVFFGYQNAYCLLQSSIAEGFCLPLAEAARSGLPILASDIPVFRELMGDAISYFPVCDADALYRSIAAALIQRPQPAQVALSTWRQSLKL